MTNSARSVLPVFIVSLSLASTAHAEIEFTDDLSGLTEQEKAWLESDMVDENFHVNRGELIWISPQKTQNQYRLENRIFLTPDSMKTGWVRFEQCHYQLDAINKIEVVYHTERSRQLKAIEFQNIQKVENKSSSVVLIGVKKNAHVCIEGETLSLFPNQSLANSQAKDATWTLKRGPYMRKFLDGYFPLQVSEEIHWADTPLQLNSPQNTNQLGKHIKIDGQQLNATYHFEGRLTLNYNFSQQP